MKNLKNVKIAAKNLNVAKGKIKDMIKSKKISFTLENGHYIVDVNEIKNILENKEIKRKTIFTVNMKNSKTIIDDLRTLSTYGSKAFIGLGSFDGPLEMIEVAKKNGFVIDEGAIISEDMCPRIYKEIKNNTASESSLGSMELQDVIYSRILQDWGVWLSQAVEQYPQEYIVDRLMDLYFASTLLHIGNEVKLVNKQVANTTSYNSHTKSPHEVKGHWRNQPYGPRNNPKYKKIWIEEFDKGVA